MNNREGLYKRRVDIYSRLLQKQNETLNFYSALRFITFIAALFFVTFFYRRGSYVLSAIALVLFLIGFITILKKHNKAKVNKEFTSALLSINDEGIKRIQGQWKEFKDTGEEFEESTHSYSGDLDIFGSGSLFQKVSQCYTSLGRTRLKELFTETPKSIEEVLLRQQAVKELAPKIKWRQFLSANSLVSLKNMKANDLEDIYKWIEEEPIDLKYLEIISKAMPVVTIFLLIISFATGLISRNIPYSLLIIQMLLVFLYSKKLNKTLDTAFRYKNQIILYDRVIRHIEKQQFKSELLKTISSKFIVSDSLASQKIKGLVKIVNLISDRNNMFYIVINILFLWDINCVIAMEKWKKECKSHLKEWLGAVGDFEALSTLATVTFDNPVWIFPSLTKDFPVLMARESSHPLIVGNNIANNITINEISPVLLITGSNMSGKSTYLRNAGLNLVLAYSGAPVNAKEFTCSLMKIFTCMRISDNLEKNISSFYAEIIRIKEIAAASKKDENVFFLLDEIFKGTNSIDRHQGAKILINRLISDKAAGMVSTHDLELGELEKETNSKVKNYHFEEYYENGQLKFDYKLKVGISDTRNAMYLIKMAGIE